MLRAALIALVFCAGLMVHVQPSWAVNPDEVLPDAALELRARELSSIIRCMKCQNQSIDDSDADLAKDLRVLVRDRLKSGDTDQQVLDYLVERYGEFVLLKPSFSLANLLLWLAPVLGLLGGAILVWRMISQGRRSKAVETINPLSPGERERITKILNESDR